MSFSDATSVLNVIVFALGVRFAIKAAAASAAARLMSASTTVAPCCANKSDDSRPMPLQNASSEWKCANYSDIRARAGDDRNLEVVRRSIEAQGSDKDFVFQTARHELDEVRSKSKTRTE